MEKKLLRKIYIEISNRCNLSCSFCPAADQINSPAKIMSIDNFTAIIKQAKDLCQEVFLHMLGEPLLHPHFEEVIKVCEHYQTAVQITTNGLLISKFKESALLSPIIRQINYSLQAVLDGPEDKNIDLLKNYLNNIITLTSKQLTINPHLYVNYRLWNLHPQQSNGQHNEVLLALLERAYGQKISRNVDVKMVKSKKIAPQIYLHFDSRFKWPNLEDRPLGAYGRCHGMRDQIGILADGSVVPCCLDVGGIINLGNCLQRSLFSIINSSRAQAIKRGFEHNVLVEDLCQRCDFVRR